MKNALILSLAVISLATACAPENPRLMPPPVVLGVAATEAKPQILKVTPKVDVLFVIDNSESMADEQKTLSENVDQFAKGIAQNQGIDFHIGVTSVWDTKMFSGMTKEYGKGELRHLKDPNGKALPDSFGRYVSSKTDYESYLTKAGFDAKKESGWLQVLRATLKIGIEIYNAKHETEHSGGPENEEIFSPVEAALSSPAAETTNRGFRRTDAHLVLIFITDSDAWVKDSNGDRHDISASDLKEFLNRQLGESYFDKVTVLGALAKRSDKESERDPAIRYARLGPTQPDTILGLIQEMNGKSMGLRGANYGKEMAALGSYVRERTLKNPHIDVNDATPENSTVKVSLNGESLKLGRDWLWDSERSHSILITRDLSAFSGALDIKVEFTVIDTKALNAGRVHGTTQQ